MENNEVKEISLLDLWRRIWKNKYLVAIITLGITIFGVGILFFLNRNTGVAKASVEFKFLNITTEQYPDKTPFNYREMISLKNLTEIKTSNEKFKNIDVEKLSEDEKTSVVKRDVLNKQNEVIRVYYDIQLPIKYFGNDDVLVKEFIVAMNEKTRSIVLEKNSKIKVLNNFKDSENVDYMDLIQLIKNQRYTLDREFNAFVSTFGNVLLNESTALEQQVSLNNWYNSIRIDDLETKIRTTGISKLTPEEITNGLSSVDAQIENVKNELDATEKSNKEAGLTTSEAVSKRIVELNTELTRLSARKQYYEAASTGNKSDSLVKSVDQEFITIVDKLTKYRTDFDQYNSDVLSLNTSYSYENGNKIITINKKFKMPLMSAVILILAGVVGVSTVLVKEAVKKEELEK